MEPTNLDELHGYLLSHELCIENTHAQQLESPQPAANTVQRGRGQGPKRGRGRGRNSHQTQPPNSALPGFG